MSLPAKILAPAPLMPLPTLTAIFTSLTERFGLSPRDSQIKLAEQVKSTVTGGGVCAVEAPTGTGKTLGYLAGALDAQAHSGRPVPIVVATATVGLQEQILRHDIPRLAAVGAVDPRKVAVAKGRGRYFCPRTASLLEDKKMQDGQFDMFQGDKHIADGGTQVALDMLKAWRTNEWDGDRDNWPGAIPSCWESSCGASSDTCVNRACEHFDRCPYMASRAQLAHAQVIVANHDIVLADLAQRADEQTITALPPKSYVLIIDEAHNLPEKAVATKRASAHLSDSDWLRKLEAYGETSLSIPRIAKALTHATEFSADVFSVGAALLIAELEQLAQHLEKTQTFNVSGTSSWGLATPETDLQSRVIKVAGSALEVLSAVKAASKAYAEYAEEAAGIEKAFAVRMLSQTHKLSRIAKELHTGLELFCTHEKLVRWVTTKDGKITLHTQPLEGQDVLNYLLWRTEIPVAMVSATLQIAGSFNRFRDKCGLPGHAVTATLPAVFDYTRGFLHQPNMRTEPGEPGFETELTLKLEQLFRADVAPGMLVLFTSRESMRRVTRSLAEDVAPHLLVQEHRPIPELVALHKSRIDKGGRSILVGLDSMAEGLDLPGRYCGHVVITRLPFAVPGDPVEEARREHLGKAWFNDAYLADMLTMLIQASGRLIRREDDHGVITVLDRRLATRKYAATAMQALPEFTRGTKIADYFEMVKERGFDPSHGVKPKVVAPKLTLVHSRHEVEDATVIDKAPKAVAKAAPKEPESALANLWRVKAVAVPTGKPVTCKPDALPGLLARLLPFAPGPFAEHEAAYLAESKSHPCLPAGTPATAWAERQMPQAVLLGLRLMNLPWAETAPAWLQVLSMRPDLMQFAEVLRSHQLEWLDERNALLAESVCEQQLQRGLAGLGYPGSEALFDAVGKIESEVIAIMAEPYKMPSRDFLVEMTQAAADLARELRLN